MDYTELIEKISGVRLVGVGESTHGTHEFLEGRFTLFKQLLDAGFNTLLLEDRIQETDAVNEYLRTGKGDLSDIIRGLYPVWQTKELMDFLDWARENPQFSVEIVGFDIIQTSENMDHRDELMASNILDYLKRNPSRKALILAHNTHIQNKSVYEGYEPMGLFLKQALNDNYVAVGQFFGRGSFSATVTTEEDTLDRSLESISVTGFIKGSLEANLDAINDRPFCISSKNQKLLQGSCSARSLGWGVDPNKVDEFIEEYDPAKSFEWLNYYPVGTHSHPL